VGETVALVPTMGYFHQGHLALMQAARRHARRVVVSLFVNPAQFGPAEDLERYPSDHDRDRRMAAAAGVDCLFVPAVDAMYPEGHQTRIDVRELSLGLCGAARPGHFQGVATVVAKLFNIVQPDTALFGQKDFQQLQVIRRMAVDLDFPVEIVGHPTVREPDGLAMSSRNTYLDARERGTAQCLFEALELARRLCASGERSCGRIALAVERFLLSRPGVRIGYIFLGDPGRLIPVREVTGPTLLALAVWIGGTRLIDNVLLEPGPAGH